MLNPGLLVAEGLPSCSGAQLQSPQAGHALSMPLITVLSSREPRILIHLGEEYKGLFDATTLRLHIGSHRPLRDFLDLHAVLTSLPNREAQRKIPKAK